MATYIIGDVQGCYVELQCLLEKIDYNADRDRLVFVGDLVNRGPDSLQVLRFLKQRRNTQVVLGNHDLYLLILGYGLMPADRYSHSLHQVIAAKDCADLLDWLRHQPLLHVDQENKALMVHAGIPPQWTTTSALQYAMEVEQALQGAKFQDYLLDLFGDTPQSWQDHLSGQQRLRYISNALTRMRICKKDGTLDFEMQDPQHIIDQDYRPWFDWRDHHQEAMDICFGHWAMLGGRCGAKQCYALDTGCAWGKSLTALRLEDKQRISVQAV